MKASVTKIQQFLEYSTEDRLFFTRHLLDVGRGEKYQDLHVVLVDDRRVKELEVEREEEEHEKEEEEMEGIFSFPFIVP